MTFTKRLTIDNPNDCRDKSRPIVTVDTVPNCYCTHAHASTGNGMEYIDFPLCYRFKARYLPTDRGACKTWIRAQKKKTNKNEIKTIDFFQIRKENIPWTRKTLSVTVTSQSPSQSSSYSSSSPLEHVPSQAEQRTNQNINIIQAANVKNNR